MATATYVGNAELPDLTYAWTTQDGDLYADMATGWTFELLVIDSAGATLITKTAAIFGAATDPNVTVAWSAGERNALIRGRSYGIELTATRTSDSKRRRRADVLVIE